MYSVCDLQLFNGSFANITKQFGVEGLRRRLEKFFSRVSEPLVAIQSRRPHHVPLFVKSLLIVHREVSSIPTQNSRSSLVADVLTVLSTSVADYNTVVKTSAIKDFLLNLRLELKKLCDEFY